ncbi:class I SAM-dependent methyltransferase [Mucilaginibacter sabulilitoris]|uniref:Class I SAM-dependent methyltransferase n=1 Tax=Mucilaginibacter sabulilitoris TaxID=1173583 RepID=A0ABZ0TU74_9SPHI|nr:class I SAM-dependent methyltransferase [Mucilaginibacter sabulilitoris]WPU96659.1 class I SAM-dependent methyltransferase [Mucilaginibacter sabulilitoris]
MNQEIKQAYPKAYEAIDKATIESGFTMASDALTCSLLKTLAASKPNARFLELGTGTGLSTSWILEGMDAASTLVSIDNDAQFLAIAQQFLGDDKRLELVCTDGDDWFGQNKHLKFDYIFADTWHGKYLLLDEAITMLNPGGLYIIDDMLPQPNWPDGHHEKALKLVEVLEQRTDLVLTKQCWATGIVIAVKKVV